MSTGNSIKLHRSTLIFHPWYSALKEPPLFYFYNFRNNIFLSCTSILTRKSSWIKTQCTFWHWIFSRCIRAFSYLNTITWRTSIKHIELLLWQVYMTHTRNFNTNRHFSLSSQILFIEINSEKLAIEKLFSLLKL